jgi:pimeloyl-ACP methyl ester carboxylesterase
MSHKEELMNIVHSADGTPIAFEKSGDGPPLAMVVGAFSDRTWRQSLVADLESEYTVYRYDRRGRGDSGDTGPYAIEREVEDLAAVIDATGGAPFLFGHSSGGALAIEAAAAGAPISKIAVYEVPYTDGPNDEVADELSGLVASGRRSDAVARFLALMGTPAGAIEQMRAGPYWSHLEGFAPTLAYDVWLCNDGDVPVDRLAGVDVPLLALRGTVSPWARGVADAIAAAAPHGEQKILEGQGHDVADDALAAALTAFFV